MYNDINYLNIYKKSIIRPYGSVNLNNILHKDNIDSMSWSLTVWNSRNIFIKNDINVKLSNYDDVFTSGSYNWAKFDILLGYNQSNYAWGVVVPMWSFLSERSHLNDKTKMLNLFWFEINTSLNQKVTLPTLLYGQKAFEILRTLFISLWITTKLLIKTKDLNDENGRKVWVIWFQNENLYDIIKNLLEFSGARFWWSKDLQQRVYQTREYLAYKETLPEEIYYSTEIYWPNKRTDYLLLDSKIETDLSYVYNSIEVYRYKYTKKSNIDLGGSQLYLATGTSKTLNVDYLKEIYGLGLEHIVINSATTNEDWTGDDYMILDPTNITGIVNTKTVSSSNVTITNNTAGNIYIDFSILGDSFVLAEELHKNQDITSIANYGIRKKIIRNNPFFQQIASTDYYISDFLVNYKDPKEKVTLDILWNSLHLLTDIVKYDDVKKGITWKWIIERINWSFSTWIFKMSLQLMNVAKTVYQIPINALDIIVDNTTLSPQWLVSLNWAFSLATSYGPSILFDTETSTNFKDFNKKSWIIVENGIIKLASNTINNIPILSGLFDTETSTNFKDFNKKSWIIVENGIIKLASNTINEIIPI